MRCGPARRFRASISAIESYYFGVAKVERDQVLDYARRKDMPVTEVERWLGPVLNYVPTNGEEKIDSAA